MIYLDSAATTKVFSQIRASLNDLYEEFYANPNSIYPDGQKSRRKIERVRSFISEFVGCDEEEIIFTSCATESNNTIIRGLYERYPEKNHIIITPSEHKSVLNPVKALARKGVKVDFLKVDKKGVVDIDDLRKKITSKTLFVGVIHVNNETGAIQDLKQIGELCRERETVFFSDTVQSFGKIEIPFEYLDFFSVSGHKINALKGVGFLKRNKAAYIDPLLYGGGQEFGIRSGTENVVGIAALGMSISIWKENRSKFIEKCSRRERAFLNSLREKIPDIQVVSEGKKVPYITTVLFPDVDGHSMVMALGRRGIAVSSGSACTTGSPQPSHVLLSYGYSEKEALSGVRFSFGIGEEFDVDTVVNEIFSVYTRLRSFSGFSL